MDWHGIIEMYSTGKILWKRFCWIKIHIRHIDFM